MVPCIQTLKADIMIDKLTVGFILELMSYKHEDKGPWHTPSPSAQEVTGSLEWKSLQIASVEPELKTPSRYFWSNEIIFHQPDFPDFFRGCPETNLPPFGGFLGRVTSRANLSRIFGNWIMMTFECCKKIGVPTGDLQKFWWFVDIIFTISSSPKSKITADRSQADKISTRSHCLKVCIETFEHHFLWTWEPYMHIATLPGVVWDKCLFQWTL